MRRVLKRREIVADDWRHFEEDPAAASRAPGLIIPLQELRANPQTWSAHQGPLGLRIGPVDKIEDLASDLEPVSYTHLDVYKRQLPGHAQFRQVAD